MRSATVRRVRVLAVAAAVAITVPLGAVAAEAAPAPAPAPAPLTPAPRITTGPTVLSGGGPHTGAAYHGPKTTRSVTFLLREGATPDAVTTWAHEHDLTVVSQGTSAVVVAGAVDTLSGLLRTAVTATDITDPTDPDGVQTQLGVVPQRPLQVPNALQATVTAVTGLDDRPVMRPMTTQDGWTSGGELLRDYDQAGPASGPGAARGAGLTVATLQFSGWDYRNVTTFAADNGITLPTGWLTIWHTTALTAGDVVDETDSTGALEVALDVDAILAVAPKAKQRIYMASPNGSDYVEALNQLESDAAAGKFQVLSISWGGCEQDTSGSTPELSKTMIESMHTTFAQIAADGVSIFAASGDTQTHGCIGPDLNPTVDDAVIWPASDPSVVAVGGTSLTRTGTKVTETAWGPDSLDSRLGSGGGSSYIFPRPAWQSGTGEPGTTRTLPDVAALADGAQGLLIPFYAMNSWVTVGGTSLASPLWAGMLADALSAAGRTTGIGDIHALLYAAPSKAFVDIRSGGGPGNPAGVGYDLATGLGSPRWSILAPALGLTPSPSAVYGWYHALSPARVLDTRAGNGAPRAKVGPGRTLKVKVTGRGGVPATGVSAVVLNTTVTNVTAATYVSVYPTGYANGPRTSSINIGPRDTRPNLVVSRVAADGTVTLYNAAGTVDLIADVEGYYSVGAGAAVSGATYPAGAIGDAYVPVGPTRILDTRIGTGAARAKVGTNRTIRVKITGKAGVPDDGSVSAVVLNTTVTNVTASTFVSVYPTGYANGPRSSNLNVGPRDTRPNAVIVPIAADGTITFYNAAGSVDLVADVEGYYAPDSAATAYQPLSPARILDTRHGIGVARGKVGAHRTITLKITGRSGVPSSGVRAVAINTTATDVTAPTYISVYPTGFANGPRTSSINIGARDTRPNLVIVPVSASGYITLYNDQGSVDLIADIQGYYS